MHTRVQTQVRCAADPDLKGKLSGNFYMDCAEVHSLSRAHVPYTAVDTRPLNKENVQAAPVLASPVKLPGNFACTSGQDASPTGS